MLILLLITLAWKYAFIPSIQPDVRFQIYELKVLYRGFPGGTVVKSPPANAGDVGSSPGLGGSHMLWSG